MEDIKGMLSPDLIEDIKECTLVGVRAMSKYISETDFSDETKTHLMLIAASGATMFILENSYPPEMRKALVFGLCGSMRKAVEEMEDIEEKEKE